MADEFAQPADGVLGLWMVGMGAVFLYVGVVLLGRGEFLVRASRLARKS